jgi:hypothetical protein
MRHSSAAPLLVIGLAFCSALHAQDKISYSAQIKPLLETKCLACHGGAQQLSELDLRTAAGMQKGGLHGPAVVPGDPEKSLLYRHVAGLAQPAMPLGGALETAEVAALKSWIEQGAAVDSETSAAPSKPIVEEKWWALQMPQRRQPPSAEANPIDAFVLAKLAEKNIEPAPRADKVTLIRRAYMDLHGLLPPVEAVDRFVADNSPDAFNKVVEGLLASPRYGERWGRHWLDVVRYADSAGYEHDYDYPHAWRFRDYVIASFNDDKPFDRFIEEQLAGDELPGSDFDALIATGFYRIGSRVLYREKDNPEYRYQYLDDMIATTSRAFLGLSVECARCHDHKFDPIKQADYYRMMAIFFPYIRYDFPLATPEETAAYESKKAAIDAQIKPLRERINEIEQPYKDIAWEEKLSTFPDDIQLAVRTPEEQRSPGQRLLADQVLTIGPGNVRGRLTPEHSAEVKRLDSQISALRDSMPPELPRAMGIRDGDYRSAPDGLGDEVQPGKGQRETYENAGPFVPEVGKPYTPPVAHLLPNASYLNKGPVIEPGLLSALAQPGDYNPQPPHNGRVSTGRRLALAEWIVSDKNPLTARVTANRIWQHHFGAGIVSTANNFGKMGERPTNPELLDWLATELVRQHWSVKAMHRLIMSSKTYQMASAYDSPVAREADPQDRLLWRYPQWRIEAEGIRDIILDAAGSLNLQAGGEPFFPPIPQSVRDSFLQGRWEMTEESPDTWRRSVYSYSKRGLRYPMFDVFDQPNLNVSCEARTTTTVPTQALTLLNNKFSLLQTERFAKRVRDESGASPAEQVTHAYRVAISREPSAAELEQNLEFLARQRDFHYQKEDPSLAALTDLCDVLHNLNEFVYVQ